MIEKQFPIPEVYELYFSSVRPELFLLDKVFIRYIKNASINCPGFDHPLVMAQAENCIGWIHFIEVNRDPGISHSKQFNGNWYFVDISQNQYEEHNPLYTSSETFFDNPSWRRPLEGTLSWLGNAFPLLNENDKAYIGNGFSWGFEWLSSENHPHAFNITKIDSIQFKDFSSLFNEEFDFDVW